MSLTDYELLQEDIKNIYIGNIFTVEANLNLPTVGKHGSKISWTSDKEYLISNIGEVHRPHAGTGNRESILTATAQYNGQTVAKDFVVTVLQKENNTSVSKIIENTKIIEKGSNYALPTASIVENKDGSMSTIPIFWDNSTDFSLLSTGEYIFNSLPLANQPEIFAVTKLTVVDNLFVGEIPESKLKLYSPENVKITGGIYKSNEKSMETFLLTINDDTMLYNFRDAANLSTKGASQMLGWDAPESLLKGHTTGHYLSAIAFAFVNSTDNKDKFLEKITYMIDSLDECQVAMEKSGKFAYGFLSGYSEEQFDLLEEYVIYPKIWAPYYTLHKVFAGLLDCYEFASNQKALAIAKKLGMWVYNRLSKLSSDVLNKMWSMYIAGEYGGMNEVMARLHSITPKKEYIDAAKLFDSDKLYLPMEKNINTLGGMHANQHIPPMLGTLKMFEQTGDVPYYNMSYNFWQFVTKQHTYNIGGTGHGEMFQQPDKLVEFLSDKNAESCATYNMLKLTSKLFEYNPHSSYMDYYEKALINHIVATLDPIGPSGESTYFTPLELGGVKEYRSDSNSCCHGTGLENHFKYSDAIYAKDSDSIYVNLYLPSVLTDESFGVDLEQVGDFLVTQQVKIKIKNGGCKLNLRIPGWFKGNAKISINEKPINFIIKNGYARINDVLKDCDELMMSLPFSFHTEVAPDNCSVFALYYGPLVMGAESDQKEYIRLPEESLLNSCFKSISVLEFAYDNFIFKPNYMIVGKPYHFYFAR